MNANLPWISEEKCIPYTMVRDHALVFSSHHEFMLQYITADKFNDSDHNDEFFTLSIDGVNHIQRPLGLFVPFHKLENAILLIPSYRVQFFILNGISEHKIYLCGVEYRKVIK